MANPAPGFKKHPDHTIRIEAAEGPVSVIVSGDEVARTDNAKILHEANYPPVFYIPKEDMASELLFASDHKTYCPFKGEASYWDLATDEARKENAVWFYANPFDEVAEIKDHLAFYSDAATVGPAT